ncbi:hypothetical protein KP509_17G055400 [Ceratopteris richardii]|uniref:malate synthase n=1 Tax=Ceratopteris richardii TaxID=49495 RepID=A0A8T2SV89_CERRI|nr:hypothetical protein KP509_17G055400 [Ceratopteris richardii]
MRGHINLRDAVNKTIQWEDKARNKFYKLNNNTAVLFVRPRGWHLKEAHIEVDGEPATGCLTDFGFYFFHNHAAFRSSHDGFGPFFYLPKMQHSRYCPVKNCYHLLFMRCSILICSVVVVQNIREAAVWNAVFDRAERNLGVPRGSIKATVLIETLPAVFQMNEILYELRTHSAGLNCGRWDYIFSYVKTFKGHPDRLLPDRVLVGMSQHFMKSYTELLIKTCHRRGVHAMGGMAAQIPIRDNPAANDAAMSLVRADKLREVKAGHDGTWAAHPGLISLVLDVFNSNMSMASQIESKPRDDVNITEADLIEKPRGVRTLEGLRLNTRVGIQYIEAWLNGTGSVPLYNLMEDAATAEISRVQNWQWIRYGAVLDGESVPIKVDKELFARVVSEELIRVEAEVGAQRFKKGRFIEAARMFARMCTAPELDDFLTLDAYNRVISVVPEARL